MDQTATPHLGRDRGLLFAGRAVRMFSYGFLAVVLWQYLESRGFTKLAFGWLVSMTMFGDIPVSLFLTTHADRLGRRKTLVIGAALMVVSGLVFISTGNFWFLLVAATVGVISPTGYEVGPFLPVEQAALSHVVSDSRRTGVFAWYNLVGTCATAVGSLCGGTMATWLQDHGHSSLSSYQWVLGGYAIMGLAMTGIFFLLSPAVELDRKRVSGVVASYLGLHKSRRRVLGLSGLFILDAAGGGFVVQTVIVAWLKSRYHISDAQAGQIFFGANVLAALSALSASWLAARIGLINTMVFTHLPSNLLLILVPFMPGLIPAVVVLWLRYSISQMDVPTRQSYTMAVVEPDERSAAAGVTGVARSVGAMFTPQLAGRLLEASSSLLTAMPFVLGGGLKIAYDVLLYRNFQKTKPPEEVLKPQTQQK